MNILLWVLQIALVFLCVPGGAFKIFKFEDLKKKVASMRELPRGLWAFLGAFECLAGLCLFVPILTPVAAAAVAVESVIVSAIYVYYRDFPPLTYTVAMAVMGWFVFYGRLEMLAF